MRYYFNGVYSFFYGWTLNQEGWWLVLFVTYVWMIFVFLHFPHRGMAEGIFPPARLKQIEKTKNLWNGCAACRRYSCGLNANDKNSSQRKSPLRVPSNEKKWMVDPRTPSDTSNRSILKTPSQNINWEDKGERRQNPQN